MAFDVFPAPKGSSTHMAMMLEALQETAPPVLCLCLGTRGQPGLQLESDSLVIRRWHICESNLLRRAQRFGRLTEDYLAALPTSPDLLVFRDPWSGIPATTAFPHTPAIFEVNGLPSWELPHTYTAVTLRGTLLEKLRDMEWWCLSRATAILTVSPVTRKALIRMGTPPHTISLIPNGALVTFFEAGRARGNGKPGEFLYVGSLQPWQGVETAITALALLRDSARMTVVHPGKRRWLKPVERLVRKLGLQGRVKLLPPRSREEVAELMGRALALLAPLAPVDRNTLQGCCPLKIIEAMAAGTAILASDLEVCRCLISNGEEGWLIPPDDVRAWAHAMQRLCHRPEEARSMGEKGRRKALCNHHPQVLKERLRRFFEDVKGGIHGRVEGGHPPQQKGGGDTGYGQGGSQ